jgi:DHA1 family multidrug resistance protein-like MFS transporter
MEASKNWKRTVYLMCLIQVGTGISIIGVISFLPLFMWELGAQNAGQAAFWAGLISGVTPLMIALTSPFWAMQADKRGPKKILLVVLGSLLATTLPCAIAQTPEEVFILRLLQGLMGGIVPIGLSIVVLSAPEKKMPWALGYFQAAMTAGIMFGPLFGGFIADELGYRMPFIIFSAVAGLCFLACLFFLPNVQVPPKKEASSSVIHEILYFMKIPRVRLMTLLMFLVNFGITGIGPILPLYLQNDLHVTTDVATLVGFIIFLTGGCEAIVSLNLGRLARMVSIHKIIIYSTLFSGLTFVMQYLMATPWGLGFWRALTGFGLGLIAPAANTVIAGSVPPEKRSTVFGVITSVILMGNVAGPVISGAIANTVSFGAVFWTTAAAFFGAALLVVWNFKHTKKSALEN